MVTRAKWTALALGLVMSTAACSSRTTSPSVVIDISNPSISQTPMLATPRILAFGDSLTEGADGITVFPPVDPATPGLPHSYPYKLQALLAERYKSQTISVFNGGQGGATAAASELRLAGLIAQFNPDVVILLFGANDLSQGDSVTTAVASIAQLIGEVQSRGKYVVLSTLTRQRDGAPRAFTPELVAPYNAALQQLAATSSVFLADVYPLVTTDLLRPDGLHLSETANLILATTYIDVLRARFEFAQPTATSREVR